MSEAQQMREEEARLRAEAQRQQQLQQLKQAQTSVEVKKIGQLTEEEKTSIKASLQDVIRRPQEQRYKPISVKDVSSETKMQIQAIATVPQAKMSIETAEKAINTAESMSENWGSKITWGDREFNLGTTQGYKDFKQALRESKSEVNEAKNSLKRYESAEWSAKTGRKAKAVVDKANLVIGKANKIIEEQNENIRKMVEANKRLIEAKFTHDYKPVTKEEYRKQQIEDTYNYLTAFVMQDIADEKKIAETLAQTAPIYISQGQGGGEFQKWLDRIEKLKRDAEERAEWRANEGKAYKDRMKPENRPTLKQIGARLEHLGLSAGQGAIYAAPIAVATALGGPLATGIVVAGTVATFANPKNRYETALFIGEHPEEFFASIAGALAAGMTVSKANQVWGKYKAHLKAAEVKKLQAQYDKMIDDYAYREQIKGAEFPSRAIEIPEPYGKQIIVSDPLNPEAEVFQRYIMELSQKNPAEAFENYVKGMKDAKLAMYYQEASQILEPTFVEEIISKHPELCDPFISPAFKDPSILTKSTLVARATGTGMNMTPLLTAALAIVAQQGYITDTQIKQLIKANTSLIEAYKQVGIQIVTPWTIQDLKNIQLSEAAQVVSVIPVQLADTVAIQEAIQVQAQVVEQIPVQELEPVSTEPTPTEPTPTETPPKIEPPPLFPPRTEEEKKRKFGILRFYQGKKRSFRVVFTYPRGGKEEVKVTARSYAEACQLAQRSRRIGRDGPVEVNLWVQAG